ncbi:MAG: preprotein translocase subunit YajC [Buchnera aphidicola (Nurudea shiraii)]
MNFLISEAFASNSDVYQGNVYSLVYMLLFFLFVFYFTIIRPQRNKLKEHKTLISSLSLGDEILTTGGVVGKIKKFIETEYIVLELNHNVKILIKNDYVLLILPKGTLNNI